MTHAIEIDVDVCIGSGMCVKAAPSVFAINDDNVAFVVDDAAGTPAQLLTAVDNCPTGAITVGSDE